MKLCYHESENFGDALNPLIFDKYLPDFFDDDTSIIFLGIGSILGLKKGFEDTKTKIVFTSGYADGAPTTYGTPPMIDESYDIFCIRGPLTAQKLHIKNTKVITDGAILLYDFDFKLNHEKIYEYSFMPHIGSEKKYNWEGLATDLGVNYISPREDIMIIIQKILNSKIMIVEAMHGAIVSDALRVPWIPVRCYPTINSFKWKDYCQSMGLAYNPIELYRIYSNEYFDKLVSNKFNNKLFKYFLCKTYDVFLKVFYQKFLKWKFSKIKIGTIFLTDEKIVQLKCDELKKKLIELKKKYGNSN